MPAAKYKFMEQVSYDHTIGDDDGIIGVLRLKPSSILWKPKGSHQFFAISLDDFREWIKEKGKAVQK